MKWFITFIFTLINFVQVLSVYPSESSLTDTTNTHTLLLSYIKERTDACAKELERYDISESSDFAYYDLSLQWVAYYISEFYYSQGADDVSVSMQENQKLKHRLDEVLSFNLLKGERVETKFVDTSHFMTSLVDVIKLNHELDGHGLKTRLELNPCIRAIDFDGNAHIMDT